MCIYIYLCHIFSFNPSQISFCHGHVDRAQAEAAAGFIHGTDLSVGHA